MKSHYHGAIWILLGDHDIRFCCLISFPTYHHLKISMVKWLWSAGFVPDSFFFIRGVHRGCQSTAPNGTIPFCRPALSARRQQFPTACVSLASYQRRGLCLWGFPTRQTLWKMWHQGKGRHATSVLLHLSSVLVYYLLNSPSCFLPPAPSPLPGDGPVNYGVDIH